MASATDFKAWKGNFIVSRGDNRRLFQAQAPPTNRLLLDKQYSAPLSRSSVPVNMGSPRPIHALLHKTPFDSPRLRGDRHWLPLDRASPHLRVLRSDVLARKVPIFRWSYRNESRVSAPGVQLPFQHRRTYVEIAARKVERLLLGKLPRKYDENTKTRPAPIQNLNHCLPCAKPLAQTTTPSPSERTYSITRRLPSHHGTCASRVCFSDVGCLLPF